MDCKLELKHAREMKKLESALRKAGLTEKEVEKIFYKNVLRVYEKVLG
ncbi:membrane dipeptidase [Sharpea azabuensis]